MVLKTTKRLVLCSKSPRRRDLLKLICPQFETLNLDIDESYPSSINTSDIALYIALKKSRACLLPSEIITISSDTIVAYKDKILGKPKNTQEAYQTLKLLSNKTHEVYTGVVIKLENKIETLTTKSQVTFNPILDHEIRRYVDSGSPMDKAGGYGIQDDFGMTHIKHVNGSFSAIMGLPLPEIKQFLALHCPHILH